MSPEPTVPEETLTETVKQLTRAIEALNDVIKSDYPTRNEIKRRRRNLVVVMVAAIVGSYFITVSTVSFCFLDGVPGPTDKLYCRVFPGYYDTFDNNRSAVKSYIELQERVARLENTVGSQGE